MRSHDLLVFPLSEYQRRIENVKSEMADLNLDFMMVSAPDNLTYLTGHQTSGYDQIQLLFVPIEGEPFAVCRLPERDSFCSRTWLEESRIYNFVDTDDPVSVVKKTLAIEGVDNKNVGIEYGSLFLSYATHKRFENELPVNFIDATGAVEKGRMVKSQYEIDLLRKVGEVTEKGMVAGIEACRPGVTENEVAAAVHHAMYTAGGEYPSVPPYITSGPRSIICHATWEGRVLERDDIVFLEMAGCLKRYHTAMMRTVFLGKPSEALSGAAELMNEDLRELMAMMKPGVTAHEVDVAAHHGRYAKFGATRYSRVGYAMGIAFAPSWDEGSILSLNTGNHTKLQENMVFHLIPWLQFPKEKLVMGLSETVIVKPQGAESVFTHESKLYIK